MVPKLGDIFRLNAGRLAQIAVYSLLDRDELTADDMAQALRVALDRAVSREELDQALLELRIFGFLVEREGRFTWAIPLLHDTLRAAEPALAWARVVEDLRAASQYSAGVSVLAQLLEGTARARREALGGAGARARRGVWLRRVEPRDRRALPVLPM